jgi:hypothetical protein
LERPEELGHDFEAVERFREGSELGLRAAVAVIHRAVVLEEGDVMSLTTVSMRRMWPNLSYILRATRPIWCRMRVPWMRVLKSLPTSPK